jgi:hypothetical protein
VQLGVDLRRREARRFALDKFQFPACSDCNAAFARDVEVPAQAAVRKLLATDSIDPRRVVYLLDWLDKVRIGLWLGFLYLDRDPLGIRPHFAARVRTKDRMVCVYRAAARSQGLTVAGPNTLAFQLVPGCFALRINGYVFANVSFDFLFCRRAGMDYAENVRFKILDDGRPVILGEMKHGSGIVRAPLLPLRMFPEPSVKFFQPVLPGLRDRDSFDEVEAAEVGPVYAESSLGTWRMRADEAYTLRAPIYDDVGPLFGAVSKGTLRMQSRLVEASKAIEIDGPAEVARDWRDAMQGAIEFNADLLERWDEDRLGRE